MKKVLFSLFFLVFASAAYAQQSYVAVDEDSAVIETNSSVTVTDSASSQRLIVQRVNSYRHWFNYDSVEVNSYLDSHKKDLMKRDPSGRNYNALRVGLPQIIGNGTIDARNQNGRLILNQSTSHYLALIQSYYGVTEGTDWYVNVPIQPIQKLEFPAFNGGSIPDLTLQECQPIEKPKEREKSLCVAPQQPNGAIAIFHPGDRQESAIAYGTKTWTKVPQPKCIVKPPVKPGETCDPNGTPPPKPPTSAPVGNPSGINPGGPPASGGPPPPTGAQAPVKIGNPSVTWGPTPTHPKVAPRVR